MTFRIRKDYEGKATKDLATHNHQTSEDLKQEERWINAAKKDPATFNKLYDKYFEQIFNFIFRRTDDEHLTADLTSQTFLKALQNLKRYQFRGIPFSAWLYRIATNEVNKYFRKSKHIFCLEEEKIYKLINDDAPPVEKTDLVKKVIDKLKELSTKDVIILELRFFEERSFKEIAYILDVSESSAKMRIYRALEKLRKLIKV